MIGIEPADFKGLPASFGGQNQTSEARPILIWRVKFVTRPVVKRRSPSDMTMLRKEKPC